MPIKLTEEQKNLRKRIIEISYAARLSHLGSCLSVVDIVTAIYAVKKENERFVLSNGHAAIALYAVLEKHGILDPVMTQKLHVHPDRNPAYGIDVSTGSLGQGLPIAVGMALAERRKNVYCCISDGECAEGSIWESFRLGTDLRIGNLKIVINANGWGAYGSIALPSLFSRIRGFGYKVVTVDGHNIKGIAAALRNVCNDRPLVVWAKTRVEHFPFLKGQDAHYYVMTEQDYTAAMEMLK